MVTLDEELEYIARAGRGDAAAFEWLYKKHVQKIHSLVYRMVGSLTDAEEVVQEIFCQAFKGLHAFEGRARFYTWIYRVAVNLTLQFRQKRARRMHTSLEDITEQKVQIPDTRREGPVAEAEYRELQETFWEALEQIHPSHRDILCMGPLAGRSYEEMAEVLGITLQGVKGRLHRARWNLKRKMAFIRGEKPPSNRWDSNPHLPPSQGGALSS